MIRFLFKGIIRDKSRSLLPIIVVSLGVMFTVILHCWINGIMGESVALNANFTNGHIKVTTRAYAKEASQMPIDLALMHVDELTQKLKKSNPDMDWVKRIRFGALVDFPDSAGETRAQGPVVGWAIDLFSPATQEIGRFNIQEALVSGKIPQKPSEVLISVDLAEKFKIASGDHFTLFGTTMEGSMAFKNFTVAGIVRFGSSAIDRGAIIMDVSDAQSALQMEDAANEILGFFSDGRYDDKRATAIAASFNQKQGTSTDEFAPVMATFGQQEGMGELLNITSVMSFILIFVFVFAMSVVLWNTGLIGSLRRYTEFGLRIALGEGKNHIYKTLIYEGVLIGLIGTVFGTAFGLLFSYILQEVGLDISGMMKNSSLMLPSVARALITPGAFYIGIFPGIISMVLGNALAGTRIYQRKTAKLFNELEV
jgi:putative ABC transport system permease protein